MCTKRRNQPKSWVVLPLCAAAGCHWYVKDDNSAPVSNVTVCRSRAVTMNAEDWNQGPGACRPTFCSLEPNGTVELTYCVDPAVENSWANCTFASAHDLSGFDPDQGGGGVLQVVFCSDPSATGQINLRYGKYPNEKSLPLLPHTQADAGMPIGCRTRIFTPEDACFGTFDLDKMDPSLRAQSVPQSCSGKCGKTPSECKLEYDAVPMILTVEWPQVRSAGTIRLLSVRHFPSSCLCRDDSTCTDSEFSSCRTDSYDCTGSRSACEQGVCIEGSASDCGDMVGRYSDGPRTPQTEAFLAAYALHYPSLGCPFSNNNGGSYVHDAYGVDIQDFLQTDANTSLPYGGKTSLIYNTEAAAAYLMYGAFWNAYACIRQPSDLTLTMGGAILLGAPTNEKHEQDGVLRQDFEKGWMTQERSGATVQIHFITPQSIDAGVAAPCDGVQFAP